MKALHYSRAEAKFFDGDTAKGVTGRVMIGSKDGASHFCMRVFELQKGGYTPRHSHEWEHEIFFHSGTGEVYSENGWISVEKGYAVFVPPDAEHQIKNTGDTPLVFVCLIPSGAPEL